MAEHARQLAEIAKIMTETAATLSTRGSELLQLLLDELPSGDELTATVVEDITDPTRMSVTLAWDNSGSDNHVTIDWGAPDAVDDDEPPVGTKNYTYATAGDYEVEVVDLEDATRVVTVDVTVPFTVTGA